MHYIYLLERFSPTPLLSHEPFHKWQFSFYVSIMLSVLTDAFELLIIILHRNIFNLKRSTFHWIVAMQMNWNVQFARHKMKLDSIQQKKSVMKLFIIAPNDHLVYIEKKHTQPPCNKEPPLKSTPDKPRGTRTLDSCRNRSRRAYM